MLGPSGLLLATPSVASLSCSWRVYDVMLLPVPSMSVDRRRTAAALGGGGRAGRDGDAVDITDVSVVLAQRSLLLERWMR